MMKILFLCDIHGSDIVFKKMIDTVIEYKIDVLILSGDLSGKDIHPIVVDNNQYVVEIAGNRQTRLEAEIAEIESHLAGFGHYYFYTSKNDFDKQTEAHIFEILDTKILERLDNWLIQLSKLQNTKIIVSPGNDDIFPIDNLIKKHEAGNIFSGLEAPVKIGSHEIITLDYTNITPWRTNRELSEKELKKKIDNKVKLLANVNQAIFNFHCPPYKTKLDIAPGLNKDFHYIINPGGIETKHVGSKAVKEAIEQYQPLMSLHGHIHESSGFHYIGRTLSLNPGSEFEAGVLKAYIIDINSEGKIENYELITK